MKLSSNAAALQKIMSTTTGGTPARAAAIARFKGDIAAAAAELRASSNKPKSKAAAKPKSKSKKPKVKAALPADLVKLRAEIDAVARDIERSAAKAKKAADEDLDDAEEDEDEDEDEDETESDDSDDSDDDDNDCGDDPDDDSEEDAGVAAANFLKMIETRLTPKEQAAAELEKIAFRLQVPVSSSPKKMRAVADATRAAAIASKFPGVILPKDSQ